MSRAITQAQNDAAVELANAVSKTISAWQARHPDMPNDMAADIIQLIADVGPVHVTSTFHQAVHGKVN
jgi:hypothetical protein